MPFALDLVNAIAKDLGPSAALLITQQAKQHLGKGFNALNKEDLDVLAFHMHVSVSKTLGPAVAESVKANILALK